MSSATGTPPAADREMVTAQLGRPPRGDWKVAVRCAHGYPQVIETAPLLEDGEPFPTLLYLTCPWLVARIADLESAGGAARTASLLARDPALAERMHAADAAYRARRARAGGGADPTPSVGIAGQRDPLATKCLHAHAGAALAGIDDPIGLLVLDGVGRICPDESCAHLAEEPSL